MRDHKKKQIKVGISLHTYYYVHRWNWEHFANTNTPALHTTKMKKKQRYKQKSHTLKYLVCFICVWHFNLYHRK